MNNFREVKTGKMELYYHQDSGLGMHYLGYMPQGYEDGNNWPLILYLHGSSEKGNEIQMVETQGIAKELKQGRNLPFLVLIPQCPKTHRWSEPPVMKFLSILLEHWIRTRAVDKTRIYLTGMSMGGYGTWYMATQYPRKFAAIAPFCGGGDHLQVNKIKHLPVWAFHNKDDPVTEFQDASEAMVKSLNDIGGNVKATFKDSPDHDCWSTVYAGSELYDWFAEHTNDNFHWPCKSNATQFMFYLQYFQLCLKNFMLDQLSKMKIKDTGIKVTGMRRQ